MKVEIPTSDPQVPILQKQIDYLQNQSLNLQAIFA